MGFSLFSLSISWKQTDKQVGGSARKTPQHIQWLRQRKITANFTIPLHLRMRQSGEAWAFLPGAGPHGLPQHSQAGQTNIRQRPPVKWTAPAATVVQERAGPQGQGTALHSFITNIYQVPALDLQSIPCNSPSYSRGLSLLENGNLPGSVDSQITLIPEICTAHDDRMNKHSEPVGAYEGCPINLLR